MFFRSGSVAKEILVVFLSFCAIVSGAFFVFLQPERLSKIQGIYTHEEVFVSAQGNNNTVRVDITSKSLSSVVRDNTNTISPTSNSNTTQNNINLNSTITNNAAVAQVSLPQNSNFNAQQVDSKEQVKFTTIQAFSQKKLGSNFIVVKTEYTENKLFDTITPFSNKIKLDRYLVQKNGTLVGYIYELKQVDKSITNIYFFIKNLTENILKTSKVATGEAPYGKRSFYYNNIDKPELLRIVIESRSGGVYAIDFPSTFLGDIKEFLRSL